MLGPDVAVVKGKFTPRKSIYISDLRVDVELTQQSMYADIFSWEGMSFLLMKLKPINMVLTKQVDGERDSAAMIVILENAVRIAASYGHKIINIEVDPERALKNLKNRLSIPVTVVGARAHVVIAEREIRTFKERLRTIGNAAEFNLTPKLWIFAVAYVSTMLNLVPRAGMRTSPRELFMGTKLNAKRDLRSYFGQAVYVQLAEKSGFAPRTVEALALCPEFTPTGSWEFLNLITGRVVSGTHWVPIEHMTDAIKALIYATTRRSSGSIADTESGSVGAGTDIIVGGLEPTSLPDQQEVAALVGETSLINAHHAPAAAPMPDEEYEIDNEPSDISNNQNIDDDLTNLGSIVVNGVRRTMRIPENRRQVMLNYAYGVTINRALHTGLPGAPEAIGAELRQMLDKQVFEPVLRNTLDGAKVIGSHMFLTDKFGVNGEFVKKKARLVALGNKQDRSIYGDVSSPTVTHESIMLCLCIAASKRWALATIDVTGAYLEAHMDKDKPVYMELNRTISSSLCEIEPQFASYVENSGKLVVKLKKALYGCIQSGLLWYRVLDEFLRSVGFKSCNYDSCLYSRRDETGTVLIGVHVDDLLVVGSSTALINDFAKAMEYRFTAITFNNGNSLLFLSIKITTSEGGIELDMANYTKRTLEEFGIEGVSKTPASENLLVDDESEALQEEDKIKFHSFVAKLLFLVKRTRMDGLLVISKLASRVSSPNQSDMKKLKKLMQYLSGTITYGVTLPWTMGFDVSFYIDASYNCEPLGRSRTGTTMVVGDTVLAAWSCKQNMVARSSTEAELIGLSDGLLHALWVNNLLSDIGFGTGTMKIYQDNKSTIHLVKEGRNSNQRTKHLDVRYFHAIDCVRRGEIDVEYISTTDMIADYFTKPLVGELFYKFREKIVKPCTTEGV
jgi:hypothetical protein